MTNIIGAGLRTPEQVARDMEQVAKDAGIEESFIVLLVPPKVIGGKPSLHIHAGCGTDLMVAAGMQIIQILARMVPPYSEGPVLQ